MSKPCQHCGYPINTGAANHPDCVAKRISELEAALRPFGDAYRFTQQMGSMRREYEASMTVTGKFTVADLHRAAELTANK